MGNSLIRAQPCMGLHSLFPNLDPDNSIFFKIKHQLLAFLQTLRNIKEISLKIIYFTQVVLITLEELPIITPQALKKRRRQRRSFCPSFPRKVHCYPRVIINVFAKLTHIFTPSSIGSTIS